VKRRAVRRQDVRAFELAKMPLEHDARSGLVRGLRASCQPNR
jgi:hypothetical protein